jgi:hypothetical protein
MVEALHARDFMVKDPVRASLWQPISSVRSSMLVNSFSFLPIAKHHELSAGLLLRNAQTGQVDSICPVIRAVSMGRRNTSSKSTCRGSKS